MRKARVLLGEKGGAVSVRQVMDGNHLIASGSERIGGIVTLIAEIADQTICSR